MCRPVSHLRVELDVGRAQAHKAREQGLVQVAVLLEGHVLDHGRQLVVVPDQGDPLQPRHAILLVLRPPSHMLSFGSWNTLAQTTALLTSAHEASEKE
jgi:hypothetical protein